MALPNQQAVNYQNYNISIMGDVGTAGAEYSMDFNTNLGGIRFMCSDKDTKLLLHARRALNWQEINIWETKIRCAVEGSDGAIIMFDENSPTYSEVPELIRKIRRVCPDIPIVLCRNRVDLHHIVNVMQFPGNLMYCEISAPSNYNIERPFLLLSLMLLSPSNSSMEMAPLVPPQALPNQQAVDYPSLKVVILGAARSGKTTFVERHVDGDNNKFDDPSTGVTVHPMDFRTNLGRIRFNCLVTTGLSRDRGWNVKKRFNCRQKISRLIKDAHGVIIMFDVTERSPYDHVNTLFFTIESVCPGIPIVLCGNKVDLQNRKVKAGLFAGRLNGNTKYCEISALSNYNFEKPFLYFARRLCNDEFIWFREPPALVPAEFEIDLQAQRRNEQEFFNAVYRAQDRRRNRAPDAPLPDHDELMRMVEVMTMK